jgi:hypothetical protein
MSDLDWPAGFERTPGADREPNNNYSTSLSKAFKDLEAELDRLGVDEHRYSFDARQRLQPHEGTSETPASPLASVRRFALQPHEGTSETLVSGGNVLLFEEMQIVVKGGLLLNRTATDTHSDHSVLSGRDLNGGSRRSEGDRSPVGAGENDQCEESGDDRVNCVSAPHLDVSDVLTHICRDDLSEERSDNNQNCRFQERSTRKSGCGRSDVD